jgi:internalin A
MRTLTASIILALGLTAAVSSAFGDDPIHFPDPNLDACVREHLENIVGEIRESNASKITLLSCYERGIRQIAGIERLSSLKSLSLFGNEIVEIHELAHLGTLTSLNLRDNHIRDLSPLTPLKRLRKLILSENEFTDITPLRGLYALQNLFLAENRVTELGPLEDFRELTDLSLEGIGTIHSLEMLSGMKKLIRLWLGNNGLTSDVISPLRHLEAVEQLYLGNNQVSDIEALGFMRSLKGIQLSQNIVRDLSPLAQLHELAELWVDENCIDDFSVLDGNSALLVVGKDRQHGARCQ